jgi:Fuc2NAc and GlcNAc transferase
VTLVIALVGLGAFAISLLLTRAVREAAVAQGLLDVPNERSSHAIPTPRGGGVAIVIGSLGAWSVLWALRAVDLDLFMALTVGGLAVAVVGLIDDRRPLPASVRLLVHIASAAWAVAWLGKSSLTGMVLPGGTAAQVAAVLGIVWMLNLFNFMDGIDGIAASEAVFIGWGGGLLLLLTGGSLSVTATALALGAACLGFLLWNWPPAKIFMGDVGSGYLGFAMGVLIVAVAHENPVTFWAWLILGGVFFVDATLTLIRRMFRGERVYQAHRSHAYQWLARRWRSHKVVTVMVLTINLFWLLPCAWFAVARPRLALWTVLVALGPVAAGALVAGAGRSEPR